jgi:hypothetical protein
VLDKNCNPNENFQWAGIFCRPPKMAAVDLDLLQFNFRVVARDAGAATIGVLSL